MKSISFSQSKSKGFSLVELLIVLGVLAILMVAAFMLYPQVRDRNQANAEAKNLIAIKTNVLNLYPHGKYTGLSAQVGNYARVFPPSMNGGDYTTSNITSAWGAQVILWPTALNGVQRHFSVSYRDVPTEICAAFVLAAGNAGFKSIQVISSGMSTTSEVMVDGVVDPTITVNNCSLAEKLNVSFTT